MKESSFVGNNEPKTQESKVINSKINKGFNKKLQVQHLRNFSLDQVVTTPKANKLTNCQTSGILQTYEV